MYRISNSYSLLILCFVSYRLLVCNFDVIICVHLIPLKLNGVKHIGWHLVRVH
jgi:hypothetical protein